MDMKITTLSTSPATVQVETGAEAKIQIISTGKVVAEGIGPVCQLTVPKCIPWSDATPKLYTCRVTDGAETGEMKFGICQYQWENKTLLVNGKAAQLRPIGFDSRQCVCAEDLWRRVLILKDGYFNAVVCEAPSRELKEACDYYGLYCLTQAPGVSGDNACVAGGAPIGKLPVVDGNTMDATGRLSPLCSHATTVWEMELEVRFGVRPTGSDQPLVESWAWEGCQDRKMDVEVYALAPSVELKLNGKSLGRKKTQDSKALYRVPYAPGKLEAAAFNGSGTRIHGGMLESASGALRLGLHLQEAGLKDSDVAFVEATLEGENGVVVCGADRELTAAVTGGQLLCATPGTHNGRALVVVRCGENPELTVTCADLQATVKL